MIMGCPRTKRKRNRRRKIDRPNRLFTSQIVQLMQWCRSGGVNVQRITPAVFRSTGRGMIANGTICPGDLLVSIPRHMMVSAADVRCAVGTCTTQDLDGVTVLALFLLQEHGKGSASEWMPYLATLPETYSLPVCFRAEELALLPHHALQCVKEQRACLRRSYPIAERCVPPAQDISYDLFVKFWCAVNTRTVYLSDDRSAGQQDDCALAPFLDFLNHTPTARVTAGINTCNHCFEIVTQDAYRRDAEVFISYGPHGNSKLLLEYGFIVADNPHSAMTINLAALLPLLAAENADFRHVAATCYSRVLQQAELLEVTLMADGCSWKLHRALDILSLKRCQLERWRDFIYDSESVLDSSHLERKVNLGLALCAVARTNLVPTRCQCDSAVIAHEPHSNTRLAAMLSLERHRFLDVAEEEFRRLGPAPGIT